jgi:hypothetical protein
MVFLFSLHAIINLHARRGMLNMAYKKPSSSYIMRQNLNARSSYILRQEEYFACKFDLKVAIFEAISFQI